jgi:hypothetical protein
MFLEILIGSLIALAAVVLIRQSYPHHVADFWRLGLLVAALIYVAFALWGRAWSYLPVELAGVLAYGLFAWCSRRFTLLWLSFGWGLHIVWDVFLHSGPQTTFVPSWYPGVCIGFDIIIAAYIILIIIEVV